VRTRLVHLALGGLLVALPLAGRASAQQDTLVFGNSQRSMVTRTELQATLDTLQQVINSPGYSQALKANKQAEADVIKERLTDGDFHTGDLISVAVVGDPGLSGTYQVSADRTITIVGGEEITVKGILRSELQDYMTQQFKVFVRDPMVRTTSAIRISIFGAVGKPGFVQAPATALLSDVLMTSAGGVSNNMKEEKSTIKRGDKIVVDGEQFKKALHSGMTLDQLNVEAGDEITVGTKPATGLFFRVIGVVSALTSIVWLGYITHVW